MTTPESVVVKVELIKIFLNAFNNQKNLINTTSTIRCSGYNLEIVMRFSDCVDNGFDREVEIEVIRRYSQGTGIVVGQGHYQFRSSMNNSVKFDVIAESLAEDVRITITGGIDSV